MHWGWKGKGGASRGRRKEQTLKHHCRLWAQYRRTYKSPGRTWVEVLLGKISGSQGWSHMSEEEERSTIRYSKCFWQSSSCPKAYSKQVESSRHRLSSQPPCTPDKGAGTTAVRATSGAREQQAASPGCLCSRRKPVGCLRNKRISR